MGDLFAPREEKKGLNPVLLVGAAVGVLLVGASLWYLSRTPSYEEQTARILEGSFRAGAPEFEELQKKVLISKDENTVESPTGLGTISMFIRGNILNRTGKTIVALQVTVSVIDQQNRPIKEKAVLVVPVQQPSIEPGASVPITTTLDGFDRKDDRANINFKVTAIKVEG